MAIRYSLDIAIPALKHRLGYEHGIVMAGSCFTENIGQRLQHLLLDVAINPNGIVFNPVSLAEPFKRIVEARPYSEEDLLHHNGLWSGLHHHGRFTSKDKKQFLEAINSAHEAFTASLKKASLLVLTFGTAWVYHLKERDSIVANCHKLPAEMFSKHLLTTSEIVELWSDVSAKLKAMNPSLDIIFTVSPVRHLRDGVHENNLSKAVLLLAVNQLAKEKGSYFPAYELVNDDLRDYRFYDADGAHPNSMAIDYVFDKFIQYAFTDKSQQVMKAVSDYRKLEQHRPLDTSQENTDKLKYHAEAMRDKIIAQYPILKNRL